ncbi:MAG: hypothetical protein H7X85_00475 [Thermoanaerobaculia bacterium]|nr:hypothetical protein [Thermoanaerobaculia bacterium]
MKRVTIALVLVVGASLAVFGCKKKEAAVYVPPPAAEATAPPAAMQGGARVERVTTAKAVNADDSPGETSAAFGKGDTVYVSMWTANAPVGTEIKARWIGPDGKQFNEDRIVTDKAGDGYTSFFARNRNGWAPGNYRVEILLNGQPAGTTAFVVS